LYLTKEEERIFSGGAGWANQVCMRILVRLGDLYGASKLIPISSAHVSGVSYKTLGDAPVEFLKALANDGTKARARATLNPQSFDQKYMNRKLPENLLTKQRDILDLFDKMGFKPSLTCTPYYLEPPKHGSHLAWAESSAVVYANSVLGAHTNREGGPSALAAAIIGKTPDHGMHKAENRQPSIHVKVGTQLKNETEFGALGLTLGRVLKDKIPVIQGLQNASEKGLKQLSAALSTTGMTNMFYRETAKTETNGLEKITVDCGGIKNTLESLTTTSTLKPDLVFVGCPHCSLDEVKEIARFVDGRKVKKETEFWVCTSRCVKKKARNYVSKIESCGGHVLIDMCTVVSWTEQFGIKSIMTNSAKTAHYAPTLNKAETILAPLEECLKTVLKG
jgi:predicted aconitase